MSRNNFSWKQPAIGAGLMIIAIIFAIYLSGLKSVLPVQLFSRFVVWFCAHSFTFRFCRRN